MKKGSVVEALRLHEAGLRAAGIVHLRRFGFVAQHSRNRE
jgi:hypothetical protein